MYQPIMLNLDSQNNYKKITRKSNDVALFSVNIRSVKCVPLIYRCLLLSVVLSLSACDIVNPEEAVPAFLNINSIDLQTDYDIHGSESHKITETWVFANGELLGTFELPATVPILASGSTDIQVRAGIKKNGISATRDIYPFYSGFSSSIELSEGETATINPSVQYQEDAQILLQRDFESTIGFEQKDEITQIDITSNSSEIFEGSKTMKVRTTTNKPSFQIGTKETYLLNATSVIDAYVEMDYRNEATFTVYVKAFFNSEAVSIDLINVSPQDAWNKIYIDLGQPIRELNADAYEFGFRSTGLPEGESEAIFLWDNVKFIVSTL